MDQSVLRCLYLQFPFVPPQCFVQLFADGMRLIITQIAMCYYSISNNSISAWAWYVGEMGNKTYEFVFMGEKGP